MALQKVGLKMHGQCPGMIEDGDRVENEHSQRIPSHDWGVVVPLG